MLINVSLSSTYAPMIAESKRAGVPLYFAARCARRRPIRPPTRCSSAPPRSARTSTRRRALAFVKAQAKEPVRIGFAAMAIPIARAEIDYAEGLSKTMGMTPVEKQISPPPAPDYTPVRHQAEGGQAELGVVVVALGRAGAHLRGDAPAGLERALRHLGAPQRRGGAGAHQGRRVLRRSAPMPSWRTTCRCTPRSAPWRQRAKLKYPVTYLTEGFIAGLVVEAALKQHAVAADAAEGPRRDEQPQGRHEGPARRPARVDQGQPFPHPAVLPRLALGPGGRPRSCARRTGRRST